MTSRQELKDISNILRRDVIQMTTEAGSGHPTSCMSAAEMFSVLFFDQMKLDVDDASNPDNDEFVLSKGHAAPIWYSTLEHAGAIDEDLNSLRELDSQLQGHPMPISLDWVEVATGSLGQGLSVATGKALAAKKQGRDYQTYALLGDSETAEGQIYEALQLGSYYDLDNLTAIVDVNRLGQRGETMVGHHTDWYKDRFSSFGWNVEVIDGHSIPEIKRAFKESRELERPTVIVARTIKGKGVSFLEDENGWHGVPLSDDQLHRAFEELPDPELPEVNVEKPEGNGKRSFEQSEVDWKSYEEGQVLATRDAYGNALANLAEAKKDVLAIDAEVSNSTRSEFVKEDNPEQFVECFIAEQNMVSLSQGLAVKGFETFTSTFSAFISRAHDQIRMASLSETDMNFVGSHAGVSIGADGASQMGLSDIALFRALRKSKVLYPSDAVSTQKLVEQMYNIEGIKYLRTTRPETRVIYEEDEEFPIGGFKAPANPEDADAVIAGAGITVHEAIKAKEELKSETDIDVAVADIYSVKPFNSGEFAEFVMENGGKLVIAEDHYPEGGIGEMIGRELEGTGIEMRTLGVESIPHSGEGHDLLIEAGIDHQSMKEAVREM